MIKLIVIMFYKLYYTKVVPKYQVWNRIGYMKNLVVAK
jgi:hypothetical protein